LTPRLALAVATLGGVGRLRPGPGTWGSAVVLPLAWLGPAWCLGLSLALAALGCWAVARVLEAAPAAEGADPGWVVVDEGAGMLLALAALPDPLSIPWVALAFALFRVLDILKPWPISWADRQHRAVGVMLDDMLAGAGAGLALLALSRVLSAGAA
jgi:phosphatidylglycerophosphatase A